MAYCRDTANIDRQWYEYDDSHVTAVSDAHVRDDLVEHEDGHVGIRDGGVRVDLRQARHGRRCGQAEDIAYHAQCAGAGE